MRGEAGLTFPHRNGFVFGVVREHGCSSSELSLPKCLANWGVSHPSCPACKELCQKVPSWLLLLGSRMPFRMKPFGCTGWTGVWRSRMKMGGCQLGLNLCHPSRLLRSSGCLWGDTAIVCSDKVGVVCLGYRSKSLSPH